MGHKNSVLVWPPNSALQPTSARHGLLLLRVPRGPKRLSLERWATESMPIGEKALRRLRLRVAGLQSHPSESNIVFIPAAHPDVGAVEIRDDEDELTVTIGTITHAHFNTFGEDISEEASADQIAEHVASLITDLVNDRVVLWSHEGAGGWRTFDEDEPLEFEPGAQNYLWSGPVQTPRSR